MDILAISAIILAYIVKGMCGFANTLIFGSIMSFSANTINITPLELILGLPSNILIAWKNRKEITAKVCVPLSLLVILGSIPGAIFLKNGDAQLIKILFGFAVIFIGIEMLLRDRQKTTVRSSKSVLFLIGVISGILCGLFGVGAFLVAYISRTTENQNQFKGNICVVFLADNIFRIILYSVTNILNLTVFKEALLLMPFMIIGLSLGMLLSKLVGDRIVKKAVIILLLITGISLILNNLGVL